MGKNMEKEDKSGEKGKNQPTYNLSSETLGNLITCTGQW